MDDLIAVVGCDVSGASIPGALDRSYVLYCRDERTVYVDPYRGAVLPDGADSKMRKTLEVAFALHWEMLLDDNGRLVVEWATSWTVLLLVSGTILWWPRGRRRGGGVLWPRRKLKERQWLRDLHAVLGAYAMPVVFALARRVAGLGGVAPVMLDLALRGRFSVTVGAAARVVAAVALLLHRAAAAAVARGERRGAGAAHRDVAAPAGAAEAAAEPAGVRRGARLGLDRGGSSEW